MSKSGSGSSKGQSLSNGASKPQSDHPDPGGNWPSKVTGAESGGGKGNAKQKGK